MTIECYKDDLSHFQEKVLQPLFSKVESEPAGLGVKWLAESMFSVVWMANQSKLSESDRRKYVIDVVMFTMDLAWDAVENSEQLDQFMGSLLGKFNDFSKLENGLKD